MKALALGLGMVAGAAVTFTVVNSLYPDVSRRMLRDGKRAVRGAKRMMTRGNLTERTEPFGSAELSKNCVFRQDNRFLPAVPLNVPSGHFPRSPSVTKQDGGRQEAQGNRP